jgi:streptogrisin C
VKKSPILAAAGGAVLAFGVLAQGSPAHADTPAITDDPLQAMERDLGVSAAEAEELAALQADAMDLDAHLDTAGAVFDVRTGALTVFTADAAEAAEAEAAGVEVEEVAHGSEALDGIVDDLNAHAEDAPDGVTGWYPSIADDTVVLTVAPGSADAAAELIEAAEVDATAVTVEESTEEPEILDIIGGNAYYPGASRCSIGHAVTHPSSGTHGFTTAGHCGGTGTSTSSPSGVVAGSNFPGADMGWVRTSDTLTSLVNAYQSGGYATVVGGQEAPTGAGVCRSGSTTGLYCGTIQAKNQTVTYPEGTVTGLTRTNVCAEPGDSGGSWITPYRDSAQAQGMTSGGSGNCSTGGVTYYQPLQPTLQQYGLTLYTG